MSHSKGLLTGADIAQFTLVRLPFSPVMLRDTYSFEYAEARVRLGGLWQAMVAALADYALAPAYAERAGGYLAGEVVKYHGGYREALVDGARDASNDTQWRDALKFTGPCAAFYADLYCTFLGPYLAYAYVAERLPYLLVQVGDRGIDVDGRSLNAQDVTMVDRLQNALYRDRQIKRDNLEHYLDTQAALDSPAGCLAGYQPGTPQRRGCGCGCAAPDCTTTPNVPNENERDQVGGYDWY